jgi:glycine dehydrogenase subunit 2
MTEPLIFDYASVSRDGFIAKTNAKAQFPAEFMRQEEPVLPRASELDVVRHYTRLSQRNFSIDTQFYPLGSCTMKYNPRACNRLAMLPQFLSRHPLGPVEHGQGYLRTMFELQEMLCHVTGMAAVSLTPMAGAQGEFAGVAMIRAYHESRGDTARTEIIVPDAAHGTNPATATMCGCKTVEIPTKSDGDIDIDQLRAAVGPKTAGIMLTNPSTLGLFERQIDTIAKIVHEAGGLLYYDGANLNAILGKTLPGEMGFDVMHMNLHKTFSTPHGGGGPGSGAVGVNEKLRPFLPVPFVSFDNDDDSFNWVTENDLPQTIGRLSAFMGNSGVLLRAYVYMRMLGRVGMERVSDFAVLNANYLLVRLHDAGFDVTFAERRASHEFVVSLKQLSRDTGVSAMDFAKALLDKGFHAPTTYFPLLVPECLLIEPTESESRRSLDLFVDAMVSIRDQAYSDPEVVKAAPLTMPVKRLDDVRAAKQPDLVWRPKRDSNSAAASD